MSDERRRRGNIELKARYEDREKALSVLERLGAKYVSTETQIDTYFSVGSYRMKLRETTLGDHRIIWYSRPNHPDSRKSTYRMESIPDPEAKKRIFSREMGVKVVVTKERILYMIGPVRVHLDRVEGLGDFLEFEAVLEDGYTEGDAYAQVADLRREFEINDEDLIAGSYSDLVGAGTAVGE